VVALQPVSLPREADAVFEGGGVKGIALVGAVAAAEEAGVQEWKNIAGTSAGAIVATLLAVGYRADANGAPQEETTLRSILEDAVYGEFADFGWPGKLRGVLWNQLWSRGMAPGRYFVEWLEKWIAESPLAKSLGKDKLTFGDLRRDDLPFDLSAELRERAIYRLRVIASDISGARMLVLPQDIEKLEYYRKEGRSFVRYEADSLDLAEAVRMSMSYPFLFRPVVLYDIRRRPHYVVDGGVLSNFPVWLFDSGGDRPPARPTWGFRLHGGHAAEPQEPYKGVPMPFWRHKLALAMFGAATQAWDTRHVAGSTAVRTINIGTGDVATTDFGLTKEKAEALFDWGYSAAMNFFASNTTQHYLEQVAEPALAHG
jgi:NTE family protein